jgi:hypothetical protein
MAAGDGSEARAEWLVNGSPFSGSPVPISA